jgi:hypothetical protein
MEFQFKLLVDVLPFDISTEDLKKELRVLEEVCPSSSPARHDGKIAKRKLT